MISLLPLAASITMTAFFLFSDEGPVWKGFFLIVEGLSLAFQFVPGFNVHFLVSLLMQFAVVISLALYFTYQSQSG